MSLPFFTGETLVIRFRTREVPPWPVLEGTVRPATPIEVRAYVNRLAAVKLDDAAGERRTRSEFYAAHIKTWNAGEQVTPALVASLCNPLFDQLEEVCTGHGGLVLGN